MKNLKNTTVKRIGFLMTVFIVVAMSATAALAQEVASCVAGIPCMFVLGQPKMPDSMLRQIAERQ